MASWQSSLLSLPFWACRLTRPLSRHFGIGADRFLVEAVCRLNRLAPDVKLSAEKVSGIPVEWVDRSFSRPDRMVLYLHGGGYYVGSIRSHRPMASCMARICRARVLLAEYRLAPEHPYPAALEDVCAVYRWLQREYAGRARILIAGDSAGGGLALAALLALRDQGEQLPAGVFCLSPFCDLSLSGESYAANALRDPWFTRSMLTRAASYYAGDADTRDPYLSPVFGDFSALPPVLIQVGSREVLLSDSLMVAERARATGGEVKLEVWPGMYHVWQSFGDLMPEARDALRHISDFVDTCVP